MTVYVDNAYIPWKGMKMCHMIADSEEELHDMASKIGLKRSWFQKNHSIPHYDVSTSKRVTAVLMGAKSVTSKELVQIHRKNSTWYLVQPITKDCTKGHINHNGHALCGSKLKLENWIRSKTKPYQLCAKCVRKEEKR